MGGNMSDLKTLKSICPCCQAILTIDPETGDVLMHKEAVQRGPVTDLGEAVKSLKKDAGKREEFFQKSMDEEKRKGEILKKKFDEAFKRVQESPDEPNKIRDID